MDLFVDGRFRMLEQRLLNCEELAGRIQRLEKMVGAIDTVLDDTVDSLSVLSSNFAQRIEDVARRLAGSTSFRPTLPVKENDHGKEGNGESKPS